MTAKELPVTSRRDNIFKSSSSDTFYHYFSVWKSSYSVSVLMCNTWQLPFLFFFHKLLTQRRIPNSVMKRYVKIINGFKSLTIFKKHSILDVWEVSECVHASGHAGRSSLSITLSTCCCRHRVTSASPAF